MNNNKNDIKYMNINNIYIINYIDIDNYSYTYKYNMRTKLEP